MGITKDMFLEECDREEQRRKATGLKCERCGEPLTEDEYELGYCDYCLHMLTKGD